MLEYSLVVPEKRFREDVSRRLRRAAAQLNSGRFRELPFELVAMFFDFLRDHRGHFLNQIDELLGSHVADFVAGKRPSRPIAFEAMATEEMAKHSRDSEFYIDLSRLVASSMSE